MISERKFKELRVVVKFYEYYSSKGRTVLQTVRPLLSDRCLSVCLSVCRLSCLSVTLVHCGQTVGWIKMKLGTQVGLGPYSHIVLAGHSAPLSQRGTASNFRPISVAAKWLHGSRCHLVWR